MILLPDFDPLNPLVEHVGEPVPAPVEVSAEAQLASDTPAEPEVVVTDPVEPLAIEGLVTLLRGDCVEQMRRMATGSVDAIVTDPPYGLEFMGKEWDRPWAVSATAGVGFVGREDNLTLPSHRDNRNANCRSCGGRARGAKRCTCVTPEWDRAPQSDMVEFQRWSAYWATEAFRVLKPGGHLLAFGGTRTYHRMAVAIEDAGFEIRDSLHWIYGTGFPKSLSVGKAISDAERGEPQGGKKPSSPNAGKFKTQATEGKRDATDDGRGYGAGPGQFMAEGSAGDDRPLTDAAKQWEGWGTALKPAHEPIIMARKPLIGTVAQNVLTHGTGALNIDGCRIAGSPEPTRFDPARHSHEGWRMAATGAETAENAKTTTGRWPANILLSHADGCELVGTKQVKGDGHHPKARPKGSQVSGPAGHAGQEGLDERYAGVETVEHWNCTDDCPVAELDRQSGTLRARGNLGASKGGGGMYGHGPCLNEFGPGDTGGASRFFYIAKASKSERNAGLDLAQFPKGNHHPTVKPVALMAYLVRLVTPPGGLVLDPFMGSGTTGVAAVREAVRFVGIEKTEEYFPILEARIAYARDPK